MILVLRNIKKHAPSGATRRAPSLKNKNAASIAQADVFVSFFKRRSAIEGGCDSSMHTLEPRILYSENYRR